MDLLTFIGIIAGFVILWHLLGWYADWSASRPSQVRDALKRMDDELKRLR